MLLRLHLQHYRIHKTRQAENRIMIYTKTKGRRIVLNLSVMVLSLMVVSGTVYVYGSNSSDDDNDDDDVETEIDNEVNQFSNSQEVIKDGNSITGTIEDDVIEGDDEPEVIASASGKRHCSRRFW